MLLGKHPEISVGSLARGGRDLVNCASGVYNGPVDSDHDPKATS